MMIPGLQNLEDQLFTPCSVVPKVLALQDSQISNPFWLGNSLKRKKKNKPPNNTTKPSNNPSASFPLFSHFLMVGFDSLLHKILKKRSLCSWLPSVVVIKLAHTNQGWVFCCYFLINNQLTMQPIGSNNAFCKQLAFLKTTL